MATEGRFDETLTQATIYDMLMPYLSNDPVGDRDLYLRNKTPVKAPTHEMRKLLFRNMFIDEQDLEIVDILWNYFNAVRLRWPDAWNSNRRGMILNKTNGFRALMRFLRPAYLKTVVKIGEVPTTEQFKVIFDSMELDTESFNSESYLPGTSGESNLFKALKQASGIEL